MTDKSVLVKYDSSAHMRIARWASLIPVTYLGLVKKAELIPCISQFLGLKRTCYSLGRFDAPVSCLNNFPSLNLKKDITP